MESTTARSLTPERPNQSRRGHTPQISISDTNHHVTEAIGGMYESDEEEYHSPNRPNEKRPLSYLVSPQEAYDTPDGSYFTTKRSSPPRTPLGRTTSNERIAQNSGQASPKTMGLQTSPVTEMGPLSPPPLTRNTSSDTAVQQFPLNDIDYESSPAAVAQELSNLQAIRRMSMNVDTADPDLPSFSTGFGIPTAAPSHSADEDDASRLFWVPARLHPELAPKEFKTFVEDRVHRMKRRSGDENTLAPGGVEGSGSGSLKRKKSMLSRTIETGKGYEDGAERLERKRSEGRPYEPSAVDNLSELEHLVNDPVKLIRKLSIDTSRKSQDSGVGVPLSEDMPILPQMGQGLKRSTRTAYRRGSLRKGERAPFSKRAMGRHAEVGPDDSPSASPVLPPNEEPFLGLTRVQTDPSPAPSPSEVPENFSRPGRSKRPGLGSSSSSDDLVSQGSGRKSPEPKEATRTSLDQPQPQPFHSRIASNGRTTAHLPGQNAPVPQIIETPPPQDRTANGYILPERRSSHKPPPTAQAPHSSTRGGSQMQGAHGRQISGAQRAPQTSSTLDDISSHPSPLPGSGNSRTDDLTMVPTFNDRKVDKRDSRKPSWGWLLGGDEKEKDKERDRDREREREKEKDKEREKQREKDEKEKEALRKPKVSSKLARAPDKARLDVLQTSIDSGAGRGRESLVLDRESIKLEEERRKESSRKSTESVKKEKDGILSAIFGGGKRSKAADETTTKKRISNRGLSPEPPPRVLKPDIDYNWTRFSILEERAIYRMAHIKLANPKRALYSQVLLSNFMYSYLAKVQMMHPQMQIAGGHKSSQHRGHGQNHGQNQQQQGQGQGHDQGYNQGHGQNSGTSKKEAKQADEFAQYQRWQQQQAREGAGSANAGNDPAAEPASSSGRQGYDGNQYDSRSGYDNNSHRSGSSERSSHDYLGYSTDGQPFERDADWDEDTNMFEGL